MVSQILTLLALAIAPPVEGSGGAQAEIRVSATIQRGVTVRDKRVSTDAPVPPASSRPARTCGAPDKAGPDCRLIVYDLP